ncbi:MAG TPA: SufE family protein [Gemmatimonadales bacterium]|nr:SufE family protein [Gemmatimonadales bacterium]
MLPNLDRAIRRFAAADRDTRLEALLDLSRKLPPLPPGLQEAQAREQHRVPECQTPVYLWLESAPQGFQLHAEVPRESPTVRGFVTLLVESLAGASREDILGLPDDLLHALRLDEALGMTRTHGLTAIVRRLKRMAAESG